ncbi:hypothetical protein JVU11DRAFT_3815 [Chiua virens]|nr:hypothetical protein JVU11DRAFT_3815 [Chiua virens]
MDIPMAISHVGSSFGNLDSVLPLEYPLSATHPLSPFSSVPHPSKAGYVQPASAILTTSRTNGSATTMVIKDTRTTYHTRPGEIYLGAWSSGGRLKMYGLYDSNVYEEAVVMEWLSEIKGAVLWYLGRTHEPCHAQNRGGQRNTELGKGGQAKL